MPDSSPGLVIHTLAGTSFVPEERGLGVMLPAPRPTRPYTVTPSLTSDVWDEVRGDDEEVLGYVTVQDPVLGLGQVFEALALQDERTVPAPYGFARQDLAARWVADQNVQT